MGYVSTPGNQFGSVIPDANEDPNLPADLLAIAKAIEKRVVGIYATNAARDTATTAIGPTEGMMCYVVANDTLFIYNGTAWASFPPAQPQITSGTAAPTGGNNGDVYFKV